MLIDLYKLFNSHFLLRLRALSCYTYIFFMTQQPLVGQGFLIIEASRSLSFRHTELGRTTLDERSARRRSLYLATHKTHKAQTSMP